MASNLTVPVIRYALGNVSVQEVQRVTISNHVVVHAAIVRALESWGFSVKETRPSTIGGLETIVAERLRQAPPGRGLNGPSKEFQLLLADLIAEEWSAQLRIAREDQNPAHLADGEGQP